MTRVMILEVDEDKYESLLDAMGKRPYIKIVSMEREARKKLVDCPCCNKRLSKEVSYTINDLMVEALTKIAEKMTSAESKSVILTNKEHPADKVPFSQASRCVEVDQLTTFRAETLGLIKGFEDGSHLTYHLTGKGIAFMMGDNQISPCTMVTLDGEVVALHGSMVIEDVRFKDEFKASSSLRSSLKAVKSLPRNVKDFIFNGQIPFIL